MSPPSYIPISRSKALLESILVETWLKKWVGGWGCFVIPHFTFLEKAWTQFQSLSQRKRGLKLALNHIRWNVVLQTDEARRFKILVKRRIISNLKLIVQIRIRNQQRRIVQRRKCIVQRRKLPKLSTKCEENKRISRNFRQLPQISTSASVDFLP